MYTSSTNSVQTVHYLYFRKASLLRKCHQKLYVPLHTIKNLKPFQTHRSRYNTMIIVDEKVVTPSKFFRSR